MMQGHSTWCVTQSLTEPRPTKLMIALHQGGHMGEGGGHAGVRRPAAPTLLRHLAADPPTLRKSWQAGSDPQLHRWPAGSRGLRSGSECSPALRRAAHRFQDPMPRAPSTTRSALLSAA